MIKPTSHLDNLANSLSELGIRKDNSPSHASLALWHDNQQKLSCFYAPFDHVNKEAKLIIVGITPGRTQMNRSLNAFNLALSQGATTQQAFKQVKQYASLSGGMRPTIIKILNKLGYAKRLDIPCCSLLWGEENKLVHFCSLLKYPIFINDKDYSGQVDVFRNSRLTELLYQEFVNDLKQLSPDALLVPLGEMVANVISTLIQNGEIKQQTHSFEDRLVAPPHPSGANAESIALLLDEPFPSLAEYQQAMYTRYTEKQRNKNRPVSQSKEQYNKARASRWNTIASLRQAYNL